MGVSISARSVFWRIVPRRFSLRGLLIFTLVIGIGLWWWRLPFEVEVDTPDTPVLIPQGVGIGNFSTHEMQTFRRSWPGTTIREGLTTYYDPDGQKIGEEMWRGGVRHGVCRRYDTQGYLYETGEYRLGKPHGTWVSQTKVPMRIGLAPPYYEILVDRQSPRRFAEFDDGKRIRNYAEPALPGARIAPAVEVPRKVPYAVKWRRTFDDSADAEDEAAANESGGE